MGLITATIYTLICYVVLQIFDHPKNPLKKIKLFEENKSYVVLLTIFALLSLF